MNFFSREAKPLSFQPNKVGLLSDLPVAKRRKGPTTPTELHLADRLRELLDDSPLTQKAFAARIGVSSAYVSEWLSKKKAIPLWAVDGIAHEIDLPVVTLLGSDPLGHSSVQWSRAGAFDDSSRVLKLDPGLLEGLIAIQATATKLIATVSHLTSHRETSAPKRKSSGIHRRHRASG